MFRRTSSIKTGPAITNASLLASSSFLPARAAARVGRKPAAPTIAAMTVSASERLAMVSSASTPTRTVVGVLVCRNMPLRRLAAASEPTTAKRGKNWWHCSARRSTFLFADSASTSNRSGWRATTSSVLTPMEPVAPSTTSRCLATLIASRLPSTVRPGQAGAKSMSGCRYDQAPHHALAGWRRCP